MVSLAQVVVGVHLGLGELLRAKGAVSSRGQRKASVRTPLLQRVEQPLVHLCRSCLSGEKKLQPAACNATASKVHVLAVRVRRRAAVAGKCYCSTAGKEEGSHLWRCVVLFDVVGIE